MSTMTASPLDDTADVPAAARSVRFHATAAGPGLWRLTDVRGLVVGHLRRVPAPHGDRFRVERYHPGSRSFRVLGEFWSCAQAVECLRFAR